MLAVAEGDVMGMSSGMAVVLQSTGRFKTLTFHDIPVLMLHLAKSWKHQTRQI